MGEIHKDQCETIRFLPEVWIWIPKTAGFIDVSLGIQAHGEGLSNIFSGFNRHEFQSHKSTLSRQGSHLEEELVGVALMIK